MSTIKKHVCRVLLTRRSTPAAHQSLASFREANRLNLSVCLKAGPSPRPLARFISKTELVSFPEILFILSN